MPEMPHVHLRRARRVVLAALVTIATMTTGVAAATAHPDKGITAPETTDITYPLTGVSAGSGGIVYSAQAGFFQKYGLDVTVPASSEGPVKDAIAAGTDPIEGVAGSDVLDLQGHGYPVEIVGCAVGLAGSGFHMMVASSVTSAKDLPANATIGVPSLLGAPQFAADRYLLANGWTLSEVNHANYVPLGSIPDVLAALEAGQIQVAPLSSPFYLTAESKGFKQLGVGDAPPTPITVVKSWAKKNPNTITDFLKGYIAGTWYYDTHESAALPVLANFLGDSLSNPTQASLVETSYSQYLPPVGGIFGQCHPQYFTPYLQFYPKSEQRRIDVAKLIDNSYVNALRSSGFYKTIEHAYGSLTGINPWIEG
jgi:ABC-type nitrate/sulfonate/bicarbonate transport system substrate-binding protein